MKKLINDIRKTIVFIGKFDDKGETKFYATGFLIHNQNIFYLATAKHVVVETKNGEFTNNLRDKDVMIFFNSKKDGIASRSIKQIKKELGVNWLFHKEKNVDIALIPFGLDPENDDVKVIPNDLFLHIEGLFETYDVFFLSYQPGIKSQKKVSPVIRNGMISLINDDKTFYIDGFAFPGNSGSPVFLKPSPIRFEEKGISIGSDKLGGKFIGIIGEYLPYQEIAFSAQTGRARVIFEENTGLSKVWSIDLIKDILESDQAKEQLEKIKDKAKDTNAN